METKLRTEQWVELVRAIKDIEPNKRKTEQLASILLEHIRHTRIPRFDLFKQQRGEAFDTLKKRLTDEFDADLVERMLENKEFWELTLEFK